MQAQIPNIRQAMNGQVNRITEDFKNVMKASMKEHFENWMKEKLMENWKREMSMIPTIFNNAEDLKKGGGLKNYLADLKKMEENANLKCTGSIDEIVEMV